MNPWVKRAVLAVILAMVVFFGGLLVYVNYIRDNPDRLDETDLTEALATTTTAADAAPTSGPATPAEPVPTGPAATTAPNTAPLTSAATPSGRSSWEATGASIVGYRIKEVLFGVDTEAVGRTNAVTGSLEFDGTKLTAGEFTVDMATVESDDERRDRQYRDIMAVDEFPTASFVLTEPIEVGSEAVEGAELEATAAGELTLRGVTNPVSFDFTARVDNGQIGVLGNIPIVFADYSIENPSRAGITTEDNGLLEFVLVFAPA